MCKYPPRDYIEDGPNLCLMEVVLTFTVTS